MTRNSVDLPDPLLPHSHTVSPAATSSLTWLTAGSPSNTRVTPRSSITVRVTAATF